MDFKNIKKYLFNCFLLTIPILLWNIVLADRLPKAYQPEIFWDNIPLLVTYGENIARSLMFLFVMLMPLKISTNAQKRGFTLYVVGTLVYFTSWLVLIYFPSSIWSTSVFGFIAPAYTPLFWLIGIGLIGDSLYFNLPFRKWIFFILVIVFLLFHNWHAFLIYMRTN